MLGTWTFSRRWSAIRLALAGVGIACSSACDDGSSSPVIDTPDAAVCTRGTEACACISGGGCRDGLLCIAGRCLMSQAEAPPEEPPLTRPRPPPRLPPAAAPDSGVREDAGSGPGGDGGPSVSAEAGPAEDSGAPALTTDASL